MAYIAIPYTDPDKSVIEERVKTLCEVDARLMKQGIFTVSPVLKHLLFTHAKDLPSDWKYWEEYSYTLLSRCQVMYVVTIQGWEDSIGVQSEIAYCKEMGIKIVYIQNETYVI